MLKNRSSNQSYFFKLLPNYLKADYAFAKNIKPNTSYRLVLFKGIIKTDEMNNPMRAKLVGGKISFGNNILSFYLPIFSPLKNIEFTIKVMSAVGTEDQTQIAFHKLKSGDYIKHFRTQCANHFNQQVQLLDSFSFSYDLFIHNSKAQLQEIVKFHRQKKTNYPCNAIQLKKKMDDKKQTVTEYYSQCDESQNGSIHGEDSIRSLKKKLTRKRGHDGALKRVDDVRNRDVYSQKSLQVSQKRKSEYLTGSKDNQPLFLPLKHAQTHKRSQSDRPMIKLFKFQQEESAHMKKDGLTPQRSTPKFKDFLQSKENIMKCIKIETIDTLYKQSKEVFKNYDSLETFKKQSVTQNQWPEQTFSQDLYQKRPNVWHKQSFGKITTLKTQTLSPVSISKQENNSKQIVRQNNIRQTNKSFEQRQIEAEAIKDQRHPAQFLKGKRFIKKIFSLSEMPLKLSYLSPSQYDQSQDPAPRQLESIKMRIFYIGFWIISIVLFFNALLPSRKR